MKAALKRQQEAKAGAMPLPTIIRRVRLYKLLRSGATFSVEELAAMWNVERGAICRDLNALREADARCELIEAGGIPRARLCAGACEQQTSQ